MVACPQTLSIGIDVLSSLVHGRFSPLNETGADFPTLKMGMQCYCHIGGVFFHGCIVLCDLSADVKWDLWGEKAAKGVSTS